MTASSEHSPTHSKPRHTTKAYQATRSPSSTAQTTALRPFLLPRWRILRRDRHSGPLGNLWSLQHLAQFCLETADRQVWDLQKAHNIRKTSMNTVRFLSYGPEDDAQRGMGPPVIWINVYPGSTFSQTAHDVSQEMLAILLEHGVDDVVVEWYEAGPPQRLVDVCLL